MSQAEAAAVDVDGGRIAYRQAGQGPPLVLLHGFLCDSRCWRPQLAGLSDAFTVVAWDAPGAGASSDPVESFTIADWSRCLAAFLDRLEIERACLVGLSWGGLLAQDFYSRYSARVARLVLTGTYAGWQGSLPEDVCRARLARCEGDASLPPDAFTPRWVPEMFTDRASRGLLEELSTIIGSFHPAGFRLMARSLADTDTRAILPAIAAPTLLLWGDDDRRSPLGIAEQMQKAIRGAELAVIANAGHLSNMEQPDVFNAHVRRFCLSV
jgi:pimeloyl-ACP methyl ester carboxylesterase